MASLLSLDEAQSRLLALAVPFACEDLPLTSATGRWLGSDVVARVDHPFADLSAMDGYAIRFSEMPGPWEVALDVAAGSMPGGALSTSTLR